MGEALNVLLVHVEGAEKRTLPATKGHLYLERSKRGPTYEERALERQYPTKKGALFVFTQIFT